MSKQKDAYYFPHDANARRDKKVIKMLSKYKYGYQWYFMTIEILREEKDYRYTLSDLDALALELREDYDIVDKWVKDCINVFGLFQSDEKHFWSESLISRMIPMENRREKNRENIQKRWNKDKTDGTDIQSKYNGNTVGIQSKVKERKEEESKGNEIVSPPIFQTSYQPKKLFADSDLFNFETFQTQFTNHPDYNGYDARHYYGVMRDYSASNNKATADWIAYAYQIVRRDTLENKAVKFKHISLKEKAKLAAEGKLA